MKHPFDLCVIALSAPFWVPIFLLVAVLVWVVDGRPVFFRHRRPGLGGKVFKLWKFRTMTPSRTEEETLKPDTHRITRLGRWLRAASLDELPELFNVLNGEMSLVGPRPLHVEYLGRYSPEQARRHEVLPGITGWAQVNGRNATSWEERFKLDVWYVDNHNFWLDIKILMLTLQTVVSRRGINVSEACTMPEFLGAQPKPEVSAAGREAERRDSEP